jgi:cellulose synthase/poly-beta-1,6-N-acetylglucosamine synthase-like glycosyltransferase
MTVVRRDPPATHAPADGAARSGQPAPGFVSVIVPVHDGERDLPALVAKLRAQTHPWNRVEYLIVENLSRDRTWTVLEALVHEARADGFPLVGLSEHFLASSYAARNRGILQARGDILAFTDVDCRPQPDWLERLVAPFARREVCVVGGAIRALPGTTVLERYAALRGFLHHEVGQYNPQGVFVHTANLALRRHVLQQVGLFRSALTTGGDVDLSFRISRELRTAVHFALDALVLHRHRRSLTALWEQWHRYGRGNRYISVLHRMPPGPVAGRRELLGMTFRWGRQLPRLLRAARTSSVGALEVWAPLLDVFCRWAYARGYAHAHLSEEAPGVTWPRLES